MLDYSLLEILQQIKMKKILKNIEKLPKITQILRFNLHQKVISQFIL
ncbi:hypothetical protein pb186bvf_009314 [Paramecium bursaria]